MIQMLISVFFSINIIKALLYVAHEKKKGPESFNLSLVPNPVFHFVLQLLTTLKQLTNL